MGNGAAAGVVDNPLLASLNKSTADLLTSLNKMILIRHYDKRELLSKKYLQYG